MVRFRAEAFMFSFEPGVVPANGEANPQSEYELHYLDRWVKVF